MFRPAKEELDALEGLGNKGWNWSSLLHYMKKVRLLLFHVSTSYLRHTTHKTLIRAKLHFQAIFLLQMKLYLLPNQNPSSMELQVSFCHTLLVTFAEQPLAIWKGPIKKSFPTYWTATQPLLFDAAEALGVPRNPEMVSLGYPVCVRQAANLGFKPLREMEAMSVRCLHSIPLILILRRALTPLRRTMHLIPAGRTCSF